MDKRIEFVQNKTPKSIIGISILVSVIVLLFILFVGVSWEINDDLAIAYYIANDPGFCLFVSRPLCLALKCLYDCSIGVSWWTILTAVSIASMFGTLWYCLLKKYGIKHIGLLALYSFIAWYVLIQKMNFTRTAFGIGMAGSLLIIEYCNSNSIGELIIGGFFLALGTMIRPQCGAICTAYFVLVSVISFKYNNCQISTLVKDKKKVALLGIVLCVVLLLYYSNSIFSNDEQKNIIRYNSLRSQIQDYPDCYPAYDEAKEEYDSIGISENDMELFKNWFSEDRKFFTIEKLEQIVLLKKPQTGINYIDAFENLVPILLSGLFITSSLLILFLCIVNRKGRYGYILIYIITFILCYYLCVKQRIIPRVYESLLWCLILSAIMIPIDKESLDKLMKKELIVVLPCMVILFITYFLPYLKQRPARDVIFCENIETKELREKYYEPLSQDSKSVYLFYSGSWNLGKRYCFNSWLECPPDFCSNVFSLGGWGARLSYNNLLLKENGISNPIEDLFLNQNVYSAYCDYSLRILGYIQEHYEKNVSVSLLNSIEESKIASYCKLIDDELISKNSLVDISGLIMYPNDSYQDECWTISVPLEKKEYEKYYCNISIDGIRHTYEMFYSDGFLQADIILDGNMDEGFSNILVFGK